MKTNTIRLFAVLLILSPAVTQAWDAKKCTTPDKSELKKKLSARVYEVTQEQGTDPAFSGTYYKNHDDGIYVDVVSGEPLFSSKEKYDSGTGWPSFFKPLVAENVVVHKDQDGDRDEVSSKCGKSHLGHVFSDGPQPTGLRYCMDESSLRFIPAANLKKRGIRRVFIPF